MNNGIGNLPCLHEHQPRIQSDTRGAWRRHTPSN